MKSTIGQLLLLVTSASAACNQMLCGENTFPLVSRMDTNLNDKGYNCNQLVIDMMDTDSNGANFNSNDCSNAVKNYYNACCNPNYTPPTIVQDEVSANQKPSYIPSGSATACDLCKDGSFPSLHTTLVAVLDHPVPKNCGSLYWYAKERNLEDRMCRPLQNYYQVPCGCGSSSNSGSSGNNGNSGNSSNGGGAPDVTAADTTDCTDPSDPTGGCKKEVPVESKDDKKLYNEDNARGSLNRRKLRRGTTKQ